MTPFELLARLAGRWSGRGLGQCPTIQPFEFAEETSFLPAPEYPMLRYEQRAWLLPGRAASHWELGLWRVVDGGEVEVSNAQDSGRVEVLRGRAEAEESDGVRVLLYSKWIANDPRLVRTERVLTLSGCVLHYIKYMATTTTAAPARIKHLEATLERVGDT